jgi:leader peptidase (prepilin peptidase)/N-methyltransferase
MVSAALDALPLTAALPLAALLGLVLGSFIATLVLRWGAGQKLSGRSRCDGCARALSPLELVPLIGGWRGRCAACGARIDPLHRRVELAAAGLGAASVVLIPGAGGWVLALFGWMLLPLALLDARHYWLPDALTAPLAVAGLLLAGPMLDSSLPARLTGAIAGGATLGLLALLFRRMRGRDGMGGGDPKLAAAIGAWLGWVPLPVMLLIASAGGIAWVLASARGADLSERQIPFGVFLCAAAWVTAALWGFVGI